MHHEQKAASKPVQFLGITVPQNTRAQNADRITRLVDEREHFVADLKLKPGAQFPEIIFYRQRLFMLQLEENWINIYREVRNVFYA